MAEGGTNGNGPSESSHINYGIFCGVEWCGLEDSGRFESSLSFLDLIKKFIQCDCEESAITELLWRWLSSGL